MKIFLLTLALISGSSYATGPDTCDSGYPITAAKQDIEGFVQLTFDINAEGTPVNIEVIKSEPEGIFDEAAICSLSKWTYAPKIENGVAVTQTGMKVQLDWDLQ